MFVFVLHRYPLLLSSHAARLSRVGGAFGWFPVITTRTTMKNPGRLPRSGGSRRPRSYAEARTIVAPQTPFYAKGCRNAAFERFVPHPEEV